MDKAFISRSTAFKRFNFRESDFTSTTYKEEIRHLFSTFYFPGVKLESITTNTVSLSSIGTAIGKMKAQDREKYQDLYTYDLGGVGPGEVALFFMIDSAYLGGGKSAGSDLYTNSSQYEVKASKITSDGYAFNFKVGGTFSLSDIIDQLDTLRASLKLQGSKSTINMSVLKKMQELDPRSYLNIEKEYANLLYKNYFSKHKTIFFNNNPGANYGNIAAIKDVKQNDIKIDILTSNTIKPKVLL